MLVIRRLWLECKIIACKIRLDLAFKRNDKEAIDRLFKLEAELSGVNMH